MTTLIVQWATASAVEALMPAWLVVAVWQRTRSTFDDEYDSAAQCAVVRRVRGGAPSLQVRWTLNGLSSMIGGVGISDGTCSQITRNATISMSFWQVGGVRLVFFKVHRIPCYRLYCVLCP